jgi:arsenical pump membrane protein
MTQPVHWATWLISALAVGGVVLRPWRLPEAWWSVLGALALASFSLISPAQAWSAVLAGGDVYLFLIGMMVLAELAREEGLFDWLAAHAVLRSRGSPSTLFALVYLVGIAVTVFLSNDATAVVLTPAVCAATRHAGARALPYLLVCAFIANAASFVLPISNPANLVVYGARMPALLSWVGQFALPSLASIVATFIALRLTQRASLTGAIARPEHLPPLPAGGKIIAAGILATAGVLLGASARGWQLGWPTLVAGCGTGAITLAVKRAAPSRVLAGVSWTIIPLVAGLFVISRAIENTGILEPLVQGIAQHAVTSPHVTAMAAGGIVAVACNLVNNLPLGLIAGSVVHGAHLAPGIAGALLIGVDLGPNLSVTGSLATILWLVALRREGENITALEFLLLGAAVMPPALIGALASYTWLASSS